MLIWLPPSEGKTAPVRGPTLDHSALLFPELADARREVAQALRLLGAGPQAAAVLGLGKKSSADSALNVGLDSAFCAPAIELYTGVLYDNLAAQSLDAVSRALLEDRAWIMSALFGFLRTSDLVPNHRLAMGVSLPPLGRMASWWRVRLAEVVPDLTGETIVDCRSGSYRTSYPATEANVIEIAVVEERAAGRKVITHMAKKWRGLAVRHLVQDPSLGASPSLADVLGLLAGLAVRPEILAIETAEPLPTRAGGTVTRATLVTTSTERRP